MPIKMVAPLIKLPHLGLKYMNAQKMQMEHSRHQQLLLRLQLVVLEVLHM